MGKKSGKYDKEIGEKTEEIINKTGEKRNFHIISVLTLHPPLDDQLSAV